MLATDATISALFYQALSAERGLVLTTTNAHNLLNKLYAVRTTDAAFRAIRLVRSAVNPDYIYMVQERFFASATTPPPAEDDHE